MKNRWTRVLPAMPVATVVGVAADDLVQKKHALLRNYPVLGHLRYLLESIGPELRQYIISEAVGVRCSFGWLSTRPEGPVRVQSVKRAPRRKR
jgi:hypothetical protein